MFNSQQFPVEIKPFAFFHEEYGGLCSWFSHQTVFKHVLDHKCALKRMRQTSQPELS